MNKEKLTGNKGEWSELYVLFKLLAEAKLYSADENLNRTHNNVDVKSINRVDSVRQLIYEIDDGDGIINIIDGLRNEKIKSLTKTEAINLSTKLVNEIKSGAGRAFSVSKRLKALLNKYEITKVSEKSSSKSDIDIKIYDPKHSLTSQQKFSIKSLLGSQPTLFNANKTTNIIYKLTGQNGSPLTGKQVEEINKIGNPYKYIKRTKDIVNKGFKIKFHSFQDDTFKLNLQLIDSDLPVIIASIVLDKYLKEITKITDVIQELNKSNPMGYDLTQGHNFYEYRIINFLIESALGMTSKTVWTGEYDVIGGIIIVKPNEEVLCYHLIDFNKFKTYLKNSCRIDNPSGSKMGYGNVYKDNGETFIKLNFQIKA